MTDLPFSATTPVSVGRVGLRARDAALMAEYYQALLGLAPLRREGAIVALGTEERELLEIEGSAALRPDDPRSAGLYHTAFLLPSRTDLARWVRHAAESGIRIDGASDHLVSEAIYLTDPEGNGIEIYADRPREEWVLDGARIRMATERLDLRALVSTLPADDTGWHGAPDGSVIGHVHLRVGDIGAAEQWWNREIGLDTMVHYGDQAVFLASGGYHHHIGANVWQSRGSGPRDRDRTGLAFVELRGAASRAASETHDPWGTAIRLLPAA